MYDQEQQTREFTERLDAGLGHVILAALEDEWFRTGVQMAREGQPPTVLWNHVQRAGYKAWTAVQGALQEQRREVQHA